MSGQNGSSFRFRFWQDNVWAWVLLIPIGILCWGMPIAMLLALASPNVPDGARIFMALGLIGVPAYLVGYIFVYNFVEGIFTKITITDKAISFRTPWVVFPIFMITKNIPIMGINQMRFMVGNGLGRFTVQVAYQKGKKQRILSLPQFKDSQYIQALKAVQERVEPPALASSEPAGAAQGILSAKEALLNAKRGPNFRPHFFDKTINGLIGFSILAMVGISGWITLTLPAHSKVDAFSAGFSMACVCFWLALCGMLPGIGQVAFWFLGRLVIRAVMWLFQVPNVNWDTPPVANQLLAQLHLPPVHSTLVEFTFWAILIISIEMSIGNLISSLRRRAYKKAMQSQEATKVEKQNP